MLRFSRKAIKHPQAPQKMMIVAIAEIIIYRGAQWRGCGNRTATLDRERNVACGVERRNSSGKRREKNIRHPPRRGTLILGKVTFLRNGANPDGCAKEQPLKKLRAADIIWLECRERKERACSVMKWSVKRTNDCNEMKLYCGCISPTERRKRTCEDEERTAEKIRLPIFWLPYFFVL